MKKFRFTQSTIMLIIANLIPLVGVLWWGWDVGYLLLTYWAENGIIGIFNIFKMIFSKKTVIRDNWMVDLLARTPAILFFIVHYGIFWIGHGFFVMDLSRKFIWKSWNVSLVPLNEIRLILPGLIGLFISHGFSFVDNYLLGKEKYKASISNLIIQPYIRVMVLHITIMLGFFCAILLDQPLGFIVVMVLLKIGIDMVAHLKERTSFSTAKVGEINADNKTKNVNLDTSEVKMVSKKGWGGYYFFEVLFILIWVVGVIGLGLNFIRVLAISWLFK